MAANVDTVHHYRPWQRNEAHCRLRIFWRTNVDAATAVVIVDELPDNPGMSVTNYAENLATEIARQYGIEPGRLVWIEYYPQREPPIWNDPVLDAETFDLATFAWDTTERRYTTPAWFRITRATAEDLAGTSL